MSESTKVEAAPAVPKAAPQGMRKNGKQWHEPKKAFRPAAGLTPYEKRAKDRVTMAMVKAKEKEMKDEKEAERKARIEAIKAKRAAKEEKERYEKLAEKMHKKRVERLKRKEKRNKLLNS
ncbi:nucleolar protein CgrA [Coniochaeta sp. 2T2.1]|nr:nucleolar protein CgrA [Coniochaeta sp. 2T2.1]